MQLLITTLHIIFLFLVATWLYKKFQASALHPYYVPALLLKLFAGITVGLVYKYYYEGGDTFVYFHDAVSLSDLFFIDPVTYIKALWGIYPEGWEESLVYLHQERALLTAKILSLFTLVSHNNYWVAGMYFSFLSFLGMFYLAQQIAAFSRVSVIIPAVSFLFFPSVVFWSSGVLKEPLAMGSLCLIIAMYIPHLLGNKKTAFWKILLSILLAWFLWEVKYYYAAVLLPLVLSGVITTYLKNRVAVLKNSFWAQGAIAVMVFPILLLLASFFHPNLNLSGVLDAIVRNHDLYLHQAAHNLIHFKDLEPTLESFVENLPLALFSGLFRPSLFDAGNALQYFVAFENTVLLLIFIFTLFPFSKNRVYHHKLPLLLMVIYILLLASILPIASPNLGTLARHKTGFLPFFIYLIMAGNPFLANIKRKLLTS